MWLFLFFVLAVAAEPARLRPNAPGRSIAFYYARSGKPVQTEERYPAGNFTVLNIESEESFAQRQLMDIEEYTRLTFWRVCYAVNTSYTTCELDLHEHYLAPEPFDLDLCSDVKDVMREHPFIERVWQWCTRYQPWRIHPTESEKLCDTTKLLFTEKIDIQQQQIDQLSKSIKRITKAGTKQK